MVGSPRITKHLRGIHNAWQFWFELTLVFTAQWLRSGGLRCSPLNAALCIIASSLRLFSLYRARILVISSPEMPRDSRNFWCSLGSSSSNF
ncbi:hypothetical protein CRN32_03950 [Vibrio vulnificus]|nr:hypothetical protein CRN32_03950 [Vibrio vulnificus]RZQ85789.1 hypothetical protein D8T27_19330 [Vibrio vulnificus]